MRITKSGNTVTIDFEGKPIYFDDDECAVNIEEDPNNPSEVGLIIKNGYFISKSYSLI